MLESPLMKKNIVLVGFMGTGKTSVSKKLAEILQRPRFSTDESIERKEKRSIAEIFQDSGEEYFRRLEKKVVAELASQENLIIDCGGGVVLRQENLDCLKKNGILFCLSASPETIFKRTKNQIHRPLLNVPNPEARIKELLNQRKFYYEQAHFTITTNARSAQQTAAEILGLLPHD